MITRSPARIVACAVANILPDFTTFVSITTSASFTGPR